MQDRKFTASRAAIQKTAKRKTSEGVQIGGYALMLLLLLVLIASDEVVYDIASKNRVGAETVRTWLLIFMLLCGAFLTISIVLFFVYRAKLERLEQSYVALTGDIISGVAYDKGDEGMFRFQGNLSEVTNVTAVYGEENNLVISTRNTSYVCYRIEAPDEAAKYLNEARAQLEKRTAKP